MAQPQRKESPPPSAGHESIDGTLSGSVLQFGLANEIVTNRTGIKRGYNLRGEARRHL